MVALRERSIQDMSFEELYQTHVETVYGFLMFKLKDPILVEDILQETFLAVYQKINNMHQIKSPKTWILSIAHHKMVDHFRKKSFSAQMLTTELAGEMNVDCESDLYITEMLAQLEEVERTIVYGLYVENLTCHEIAQILNIPEGTVKSKAYYARKKLRKWLKEGLI